MNSKQSLLIRFLALLLVSTSLPACAVLAGPDLQGEVREAGTKKPVSGAIVVARWIGSLPTFVDSQTVCVHVDTTTTDKEGKYSFRGWAKRSPVGPVAMQLRPSVTAYKASYELVEVGDNRVYLRQFKGTREERLAYLSRIATSCSDKAEIEINLIPFYRALYSEANAIAVTREDKLKVLYRLRDVERLELGSDLAWENFRKRQAELQ